MANYKEHARRMEERLMDFILNTHVAILYKSLEENKSLFSFITDRHFTTRGGALQQHCKKIDAVVTKQLKLFGLVIDEFNKFQDEDCVLTDDTQDRIFRTALSLKQAAIRLGYCEEATELLKILSNPNLVGRTFAEGDVKDDVLAIMANYGKIAILEEDPVSYKLRSESLVDAVCNNQLGAETNRLSIEEMHEAYDNATIVRGDVVYKTDGTCQTLSKNK